MKLALTRPDLAVAAAALSNIVRAGTLKEADMKPNSTDYKVLQVNKACLEKITYADGILEKEEGRESQEIEFNRQEAKVLIATMLFAHQLQTRIMGEYEKRPDDHPSFKNEPGRTRADYISRLGQRIAQVNTVLTKIRLSL